MSTTRSPDAAGGAPLRAAFTAFPIACFTLTLLGDLAYWATANLMWKNFSAWLLFAGLVGGGLAVLAWIVAQAVRPVRPAWIVAGINVLVLVAAFLNSLVHAGDGWTGVVPWGLALSALTILLMLVSGLLGGTASRR